MPGIDPGADPWLIWSGRIDAIRLFPRILIIGYYSFFVYAWLYVVDWFMAYNWASVTNEAVALALAGFPAAILGVLSGVLGSLTKGYVQSGQQGDRSE